MRFFPMICLFLLCVSTNFAKPLNGTAAEFDIKKANQQFDHINLQLSVQNLNLNNLNTAVDTLEDLITKADQCTEDMQKKLNNVELLIKQGSGVKDGNQDGADFVYLENQKKDFEDEQAKCRLFSIRAKEAIEAYKTAIIQLKQEETLTRGLPLWQIVNQTINSPPEITFKNLLVTQIPAALPPLFSWIIFICIAAIGSTIILLRTRKSRFSRRYLRFKRLHAGHIILVGCTFVSAALFAYLLIATQDVSMSNLPLVLSGLIFFYLLSFVSIVFLFKVKNVRAFFYWYSLDNTFFKSFSVGVLSFYSVALIGQLFSSTLNTNSPLWQLCQSMFILATLTIGAYFIFYFCRAHRHYSFIKHHYHFIQRSCILLFLTCALINIFGYYTLAQYLTFSGFTTFFIIFITLLLTQGIKKLYLMLNQQQKTKANVIKLFGYRKDQVFTEFLILKTVAQIIIIAASIYAIGKSWGFAAGFIESLYDQFLYGIHLVNVTIYPTRIIAGTVIFCLLYLLFRAISTAISSHQQFEDEEETQVAVASILTYIGFAIAAISGLLIAGFDFTGLAIIAGALSVGIGLGLQSIVNNFVSGLILLIEKPIRPGDRINVDGVEGFVKKIRVRSTQIMTPAREDIIVPNSDLITRRVTNYMFSDKYCRITCEIGVAYGTDTHLVRDILLNIANNNDEVIKGGRNKPIVLFRSFADSSLLFQLVCLLKDVNKKALIQSELNYAIEQAFREHKIEIPYPQRELHIKLSELESLIAKTKKKPIKA